MEGLLNAPGTHLAITVGAGLVLARIMTRRPSVRQPSSTPKANETSGAETDCDELSGPPGDEAIVNSPEDSSSESCVGADSGTELQIQDRLIGSEEEEAAGLRNDLQIQLEDKEAEISGIRKELASRDDSIRNMEGEIQELKKIIEQLQAAAAGKSKNNNQEELNGELHNHNSVELLNQASSDMTETAQVAAVDGDNKLPSDTQEVAAPPRSSGENAEITEFGSDRVEDNSPPLQNAGSSLPTGGNSQALMISQSSSKWPKLPGKIKRLVGGKEKTKQKIVDREREA